MNVLIRGAGDKGQPLAARVLRNDGVRLTLDAPAAGTVRGAALVYGRLVLGP
jgi:hypothetical protein